MKKKLEVNIRLSLEADQSLSESHIKLCIQELLKGFIPDATPTGDHSGSARELKVLSSTLDITPPLESFTPTGEVHKGGTLQVGSFYIDTPEVSADSTLLYFLGYVAPNKCVFQFINGVKDYVIGERGCVYMSPLIHFFKVI